MTSNLSAALDDACAVLQRFVAANPETMHTAALWAALTHMLDHVDSAPVAAIVSPHSRSGKSIMLSAVGRMSARPVIACDMSQGAMLRLIEQARPTLLLDSGGKTPRLFHCGNERSTAFMLALSGGGNIRRFSTWCAKAFTASRVPALVRDKAIVIPMRRRGPFEKVERLHHAEPGAFDAIARRFARLAIDQGREIADARPRPGTLNADMADNWLPLIALADLAGNRWPARARQAATQ